MVFSSNELDMLVLQNGEDGIPADSKYIWVKYSQNANGVPLTDDPTGAVYIGIAYNKDSIEESNNPDDYSWSKILGDKGEDAYTIILSNENISFSVSYEDNLAIGDQSFTTDVRVFYGATERDDFVIGEIGSSNGITVSKTVNSVTLSVTDSTKIAAKHGYFRIPISIDGLIFYKDMSWNTVPQGVPGSVGQSALNVSLGNESQNIPCNSEGVTLESFLIEIPFAAYEGFNKVACTASVGVLPSGITLGQNTGSTPDTDGLIILNVARGSNLGGDDVLQGKVVITFIIGESEVIKNFTWTKTKDGATGEAGQFTLYSLESSAPVISKTFEDTFSPESITFSAYSMEGNSGDKTEYSGMFIIEESTNGTTYDTSYLSSADEQSVTFTPTSINVISIRCTLYKAGGITSALDIYTVPVLTDVDNMRPIIDEITTSISGVETKIDSVEKSITNKVWQSDITDAINNYDGTTVKTIRDQVSQINISIDGITSEVSDVKSTLTTKADGSVVQELSEKVSSVEQDAEGFRQTVEDNYVTNDDLSANSQTLRSEFNQTASEISQNVSDLHGNITSINQDMSSIEQRVEDAEGNITTLTQTAENVQSQISNIEGDISNIEQDASSFKTEITDRVSNAESEISQNAERIALTAEKTEEIGTKLDNLEVGGRNFWPNSSFQNDLEGYLIDGASTGTVEVVEGYGGRSGIRITRSGYEGTSRIGLHIKPILTEYSAGDEFTLSAWIKIDAAFDYENNDIFVRGVSGDNANYDRPLIDNITHNGVTLGKWMRYETTFTAESDGTFVNCYILMGKNGDMTVSNVKFERGNKVTDWTPAPEDFENNYYSKTETEALLQVESDKITSKVSQTITEEVNKIEIGGRNLLLDTNTSSLDAVSADEPRRFQAAISNSENYDVSWVPISDAPQGIEYGAQIEVITASETDNYQGLVFYSTHGPELTNGETYTLSYYARCTQGTAYTRTEIWNHHISDPLELTEDWAKNSLTFTFDDSESSSVPYALFQTNLKYVGIIQMCGFKLEKGNKATDWTPAPEDVDSGIQNAQNTADEANNTATSTDERVTVTESEIQQLADSISMLVTDGEGNSMMTQTSDGWRFDISQITDNLNEASNQLNDLAGDVAEADSAIQNIKDLANDLSEKTAYIVMATDDSGAPCIELGKSDNDFKVRITNTSVDFMDGSSRIAYVSNQALYIERAIIKDELQIGEGSGYVWKKRSNGNMGLRYVGG